VQRAWSALIAVEPDRRRNDSSAGRSSGEIQRVPAMSKRAILIPVVILAVAALLFFTISGRWLSWEGNSAEQRTDDAYVRADMVPLSTRISGTVRKLDVQDFQAVKAGQTLVRLDDEDYRAVLDEAKAAVAAARAQLEENQVSKRIQESKIENAETVVTQTEASVTAAQAGVAAVQPDVERTALERNRQQALLASKATTRQANETAEADAGRFTGMLASRQADLKRAEASLTSSRALLEAEKRQLDALSTRDSLYQADIQAKQAATVVAEVNLGYTRIPAPADGAVGERHVQEGQLIAPGMQVVDLVKGDVWIQANYKETQLTNIRQGDRADIKIDTFPGVVLHGKVQEISPASGSQFALLPPDNATGNFTKVVQRIPVKILLDADHPLKGELRPGFSAVVTIHASGRNGSQP
jgi:membrane fusion protein (multidrug efflux system)